jgi:RNA polymerase sigma factor, sigma-70 family
MQKNPDITQYTTKLTMYALGICADRELARDTVQDVFVEYLKNPPRKTVASWFYMVCKNKLLNKLAREKRKSDTPEGFFERIPEERANAPKKLEQSESFAALHSKLKDLPADQREAITLKYFEDFSYAQIAEIMETTPANVGNIIFRGMANLRKTINKEAL